jgi:hypothetical protein
MRGRLNALTIWTSRVTVAIAALAVVFIAGLVTLAAQQRAGEMQMWDGVYTAAPREARPSSRPAARVATIPS